MDVSAAIAKRKSIRPTRRNPWLKKTWKKLSRRADGRQTPENFRCLWCAIILGYTADENKFSPGERIRRGAVVYID